MQDLRPVPRHSLSDAVFQQLRDRIVSGAMAPGERLPGERALCEALGVNRGAVREALKRLAQARLVSVRHGGSTAVLDYRESAGLDLLADLLVDAGGDFDLEVVASVIEMRSALAPDIARLAALRGDPDLAIALDAQVAAMHEAGGDVARLQMLALEFWDHLVRGCGNLAYRLAFNSLRETYGRCMELLTTVMAEEFRDTASYAGIARAVCAGEEEEAELGARALMRRGELRIKHALDQALEARES